jgi:hypothetical protein
MFSGFLHRLRGMRATASLGILEGWSSRALF